MIFLKKIFLLIFACCALLSACAPAVPEFSQNGIEIYSPRVFLPGGDAMSGLDVVSAAYMTIKNVNDSTDRLVGVSADFADASLHETKMQGDVMSMDAIPEVEIPAGQMVELRSGSYHIMLVSMKREIKVGEQVQLILEFEKAGRLLVPARVTGE